jgi:hypothetical protein
MKKFDTPTAVTAVLDIPAGRIQFIAADRTDTIVEVRPVDPSKSRDVKAAEQITVEYGDGVLRIAAPAAKNQYFGPSGSVEVTVQLPAGSGVQAKAGSAEFRGVGRLGDVAFDGGYGKHSAIKIDEAASARLAAHGGDVQIGRLSGPATISTGTGDIGIDEATDGTVELRTGTGNVSVGAARGVSASLDAGTGYGRIHNSLQNTEGAAAALNIHATTGHGDIAARSL